MITKPLNQNLNKTGLKDGYNNRPDTFFWFILLAAFMIRIWGIWNVSTTDEYNEVIEALRVASGHLNFERWIKRLYLYILAGEFGVYYILGRILGIFLSPIDFAEKIIRNMEPLFILGRITSAILGTYTVCLTYVIGKRFFNRRVGMIASFLLCITVFHVDLSQQAKVDALLGALCLTVFYFIFRLLSERPMRIWDWTWCGVFFGLAIQAKLNVLALLVPITVTFFLIRREIEGKVRAIIKLFIGALIGFILGNPPVILAPIKFLSNILGYGTRVYTTPVNVVPSEVIGFLAYPFFYLNTFGWPISLLTIGAFVYALVRINATRLAILSFIVAFYIEMGFLSSLVDAYYLIPIVPLVFLLVGEFTDQIYYKIKNVRVYSGAWAKKTCLGLVSFLLIFHPLSNLAYHELSLLEKNSRYLAKEWVEANIPAGSKILMDSGKSINSFAPPIAENAESLKRILGSAQENVSKGKIVHEIVDRNALIYYELLLKTAPERAYDITSTMFGLELQPLDYYLENGYEYFIISGSMKRARTNKFAQDNLSGIANFYLSLDSDDRISLVKVIGPSLRNRGDQFLIYKTKL